MKSKSELNQYYLWLLLFAAIIAIFPINQILSSERKLFSTQQGVYYDTPKQLLGGLLGEFRATIADILWVKVDDYFHSSVSEEDHERIHPGHKDWHPNKEAQHRAETNPDAEFMPLIRLVTWLDPSFMMAYQVGGWWLSNKLNKQDEAVSFLKEAIQNNPHRYEGYYELGWLYHRKFNNDTDAINNFNLGLRNATQPEDKVLLLATIAALEENRGNIKLATKLWQDIAKTGIEPQASTAKRWLADLQNKKK
ncbi:MAG: tetratricopeptide repeat protein [bacterium]